MATLALLADGPGKGSRGKVRGAGSRTIDIAVYTLTLDSSYPTGGESLADIFTDFKTVLGIFPSHNEDTVADVRYYVPDLTNQKLLAFKTISAGANAEVADTNSLAGIIVTLLVVGYK